MSDAIRRSFDAIAEAYARRFTDELERKPYDRDLLAAFAADLPQGATMLDIGTGAGGHIGRFFADRGFDVTGVDLSAGAVEVARRVNPSMHFEVADFRSLPQADSSVDAVVAFHCFIYGNDDDIVTGLSEVRRVLRGNGRFLASVHGALDDRPAEEAFREFEGTPIDVTVRYTSPASFATLAERARLRVAEVRVRDPYPFEHPSRRIYLQASAH